MTSSFARGFIAGLKSALLVALLGAGAGSHAATVQVEDLTWVELRGRIDTGTTTTVLLPIGGTEQNGPHMTLGKHNVRVKRLATQIAEQLGNAVVAPVLAYVPEGRIDPPTQHMRYAGTLSIPEPVFEATLEAAARSLRRHGLRQIVLLGDHGGYRASLDRVAAKLNREWGGAARVHALPEYYRAAQDGFAATLQARGFSKDQIGAHAGLADTSLMLALDPTQVRMALAAAPRNGPAAADGVVGDPRRASAELGQLGVAQIVEATVAAIRAAVRDAK
jgi:creatinine amidohydrolase